MKPFALRIDPLTSEEYIEVRLRGNELLADPFLNKGSAFTQEERLALGLSGLLRSAISDIETQRKRNYQMYARMQDDLEKYIYLQSLLNRNETLFYSLLRHNLLEMLPIVYTPTVGQACLMLSHITREYRGIYVSPDNIGDIDSIFRDVSLPDVSLIVTTDGERILGLGDLGSDGMGIPVGKINLYVAAGGLHPACCLPVCLDVGTNNERLLQDPLYLGYRKPRLTGEEYFDFVERFVLGVKRNFPHALLQWEDFAKHTAFTLLDRYRERVLSFNDDIQGTGAVALAALISAMRIKGQRFRDQRYVIVGMGQAGTGIAANIRTMLQEEGAGEEEIRAAIFACDAPGLLVEGMPGLSDSVRLFTQRREAVAGWTLESPGAISFGDAVRNARATVLIGVTAQTGLFDETVLASMAANDPHPVIFALSNPTSKCECTPEQILTATRGGGIMAFGSPFPVCTYGGNTYAPSQCNNMFIFPGMGLGALVSRSTRITSQMFLKASRGLSDMVGDSALKESRLLPPLEEIREVAVQVARAVAIEARDSGLGRLLADDELERLIRKAQWEPHYYPFRPAAIP